MRKRYTTRYTSIYSSSSYHVQTFVNYILTTIVLPHINTNITTELKDVSMLIIDSIDKVSAQSLESVGRLVELGFRARVWSEITEPVSHEIENVDLITDDGVEIETKSLDLQSTIVGSLIIFMLFATIAAVACVIFAENEGEL